MLTAVLAHAGQPPAPHDIWRAWNVDPLLVALLVLTVVAFRRGGISGPRAGLRRGAFFAGVGAVAVALISPLDAASSALASAHMIQHVLLVLVAAPLLALAAPSSAVLRGSPLAVRRGTSRVRRRLRLTRTNLRVLRNPLAVWLLHVVALWVWHAAVLYDAAVRIEAVHVVEHASFLVTGMLFWHVVVGARSAPRGSQGAGVLLVFTMAVQSVLLSALLVFAGQPWYGSYLSTTAAWGLEPLADQQLAGVIMWVPAGAIYVVCALVLLAAWIRDSEETAGMPVRADG